MNNTPKSSVLIVMLMVTLVLTMATDSEAGRRDQRGFQIYFGIGSQGYEIKDRDYSDLEQFDDEGMGFLGIGYGLNEELLLFLEGGGSEHEADIGEVTFGYLHLGLKYAPAVGNKWQLYGKASLGGIFLVEEDRHFYHDWYDVDRGYSGPSLALAVGLDRYISRRAAVFGELAWLRGEFDHRYIDDHEFELQDDVEVSSGRLQFGIRFGL